MNVYVIVAIYLYNSSNSRKDNDLLICMHKQLTIFKGPNLTNDL
jgi:hypothetical protein